jgi:hypothetical protein
VTGPSVDSVDGGARPWPDAVELGPGLFALCNPYALDGRVSSHPRSERGWAPMNVFLMLEDDGALLLDAGLSVHEDALLDQIGACLPAGVPLSICPIRMGEFSGVCNVRPIAERFRVDVLYGMQERPMSWMDFRPEFRPSITDPGGGGSLRGVPEAFARPGQRLPVGLGGRELLVLPAPLRLLPVTWMYDPATRTLMTADAFTWVSQDGESGPWVVEGAEAEGTERQCEEHLLTNRFWWLPGARTDPIRSEIAQIFDSHDVEILAPGFGCVLKGRDVVQRHYAALDRLLAAAQQMEPIGVESARWTAKEAYR